jgi:ribosome-binding protein aMBF1 (putative translation factor)
MNTFQITSVILLSFIGIVLGIGLAIGYKSIIRRAADAKSLQDKVNDLAARIKEVQSAIQSVETSSSERLNAMIEEIKELRKDLDEATHF